MRLIELKRKDGKPLWCQIQAISHWTESTESSNLTTAWIGGKEMTLGHPADELTQILELASAPQVKAVPAANPKYYGRNK